MRYIDKPPIPTQPESENLRQNDKTSCPHTKSLIANSLSDDKDSPADTPSDGGWKAWLSLAACFFTIMNTWGLIISFGVFQAYYVSILDQDASEIAWIGSLSVFLLFFVGIVSGGLTDSGYFRITTSVGAFLIVFGTFMTSLCHSYWQLILAQGICIGLGNGCLLTPMMTVIITHFKKKLPVVMGIAACGSVTGGLIYPSIARTLLPTIGFGWTMRVIGFIQLGTLAIALLLVKPIPASHNAKSLVDWTAFRETAFVLYTMGAFLSYLGVFVPFFFLSSYAQNDQGMSYTESLDLLLVLNGIGIIGRILPSILAWYLGSLNVFIVMLCLTTLSMYAWIAVDSTTGLYVWTTYYGLVVGGVQSLFPSALTSVSLDLRKAGSRLGIVSAAVGIGSLIGSPLSGVLISKNGGSYVSAQIFGGSTLAAGALFTFAAREIRRREAHAGFWTKL